MAAKSIRFIQHGNRCGSVALIKVLETTSITAVEGFLFANAGKISGYSLLMSAHVQKA